MLRRGHLLLASFLAMEALAFFVVGAGLSNMAGHAGLAYPAYLAAEAGGYLLVRALLHLDLSTRRLIVLGGAVTVLALVTIIGLAIDPSSFPPGWGGVAFFLRDPGGASAVTQAWVLYGITLVCVAWARGVYAAQERLERGRALRSFSIALVVLLFGLLFGRDTGPRGAVNAASMPMVALGLSTLALLHLGRARQEGAQQLGGPWLLIVGGAVGSLVLAGAVLGVLPLGPLGYLYDHAIGPALLLLLTAVAWVVIAVSFPIAWLLSQILIRFVGGRSLKPPPPQQSSPDDLQQLIKRHAEGGMAGVFVVLFKLLAILVAVALICYLAYRLFRRLHMPPVEGEERDTIEGEGSLTADLMALLRSLRPRRSVRAQGPAEPSLSGPVLEARRLYLRLLQRSAQRGHARPETATPLEFEPVLERTFASTIPAPLTETFIRARYGLMEPTAAQLAELREQLKQLD